MNRARLTTLTLAFVFTLTIRILGITREFWLLGDQIRDWTIALHSFTQLPIVGPPTASGGHTIGPVFYWGLWLIRVIAGPWLENLPHAGGIGQAILQSVADTLLLAGIWRRTRSAWLALAATLFIGTASYDLSLSATVSNPMMGSALAKIATALVLLGWPERSAIGVGMAAGTAWCAVQCDAGALFPAAGIFAALLALRLSARDRASFWRNAWIIAIVVAVLQVPHALYQEPAGLTDGTNEAFRFWPHFDGSWRGFLDAFSFLQVSPWQAPWAGWLLMVLGAIVGTKYWRDPALLAVTLVPLAAALVACTLEAGVFADHDSYLSVMPAAVLTMLLGATAVPSRRGAYALTLVAFAVSVAIVPVRLRFARTMHRLPEYGALVDGSRRIVRLGRPMRAVHTEFTLPPTSDPEFLYTVLGGRIDPGSPWVALIRSDGAVVYQRIGGV